MNRDDVLGAVARGWCDEKNSGKVIDPDLAESITNEVMAAYCPALSITWEDPYEGDMAGAIQQLQGMVLRLLNKEVGIS